MKRDKFLICGLIMLASVFLAPVVSSSPIATVHTTLASTALLADPGVPDTVRLGCPIVASTIVPGDSIAVPFYLWNDEELAAFSLGFSYDSDDVEITSWSAAGGVIPVAALSFVQRKADPDNNSFLTGWIDISLANRIPATSGSTAQLLGTLYLRVMPGATPQVIDIDSAFVQPAGEFALVVAPNSKIEPRYVDCGTADVVLGADISCGDADGSGVINISDALYLLNYLFAGGTAPNDSSGGDVNCDNRVNLGDVVHLINFIFSGGPHPCASCP